MLPTAMNIQLMTAIEVGRSFIKPAVAGREPAKAARDEESGLAPMTGDNGEA